MSVRDLESESRIISDDFICVYGVERLVEVMVAYSCQSCIVPDLGRCWFLIATPLPSCHGHTPFPCVATGATLFVGNLSFNVGEEELMDFFTSSGHTPQSVRIITKDGMPRG